MKRVHRIASRPLRWLTLASLLFASGAMAQGGAAKPDLAKGKEIASQVCAACHGADGNSPTPANPKLAGQHPAYLYKQLREFKLQQGATEARRVNAIMVGFAQMLSDADMRSVAAYYGTQQLKPAAAKDKDIVEAGQKIYRGGIADKHIPACAGCHSPNGAGIPNQFPRIAGQFAEYTEAQLVAFRQGTRKNSVQMAGTAARLSDAEIKAVSDYVAGMR